MDLFAARMDNRGVYPPTIQTCDSTMLNIRLGDVLTEFRSLDVWKANEPDVIPALVLTNCSPELFPALMRLYRLSYYSRILLETV